MVAFAANGCNLCAVLFEGFLHAQLGYDDIAQGSE